MEKRMSQEYRDYLRSPEWAVQRITALFRAGNKCQQCGIAREDTDHLDVHHITYARFLRERKEDLMVLCRLCHDRVEIEKKRRGYPEGKLVDINEVLVEFFNVLDTRMRALEPIDYTEATPDECPF